MSDIKLIMEGQLALADLNEGNIFENMDPYLVRIIELALITTPRAEWEAWTKEKLMQTPNASYWGFKAGIDY